MKPYLFLFSDTTCPSILPMLSWNTRSAFSDGLYTVQHYVNTITHPVIFHNLRYKAEASQHYSDVEVSKIVKYLCDDLDNISNLALLVMFSTGLRRCEHPKKSRNP